MASRYKIAIVQNEEPKELISNLDRPTFLLFKNALKKFGFEVECRELSKKEKLNIQ